MIYVVQNGDLHNNLYSNFHKQLPPSPLTLSAQAPSFVTCVSGRYNSRQITNFKHFTKIKRKSPNFKHKSPNIMNADHNWRSKHVMVLWWIKPSKEEMMW